ncbi:2OG-Fe(II) oxygenase [Novosphingobium sp. TH158]|uniref:2OG-Fe(II) oxygenase n=1 Tax=Novosphingobium sp. TH158 TaxID=2067455 RepID=UPI00130455E3|nr:2OG-Fe(II) oxygenase [Novosphingobium sp. TH158]
MAKYPPHLVIDGFLPQDLHDRLLAHTLASEDRFLPTSVRNAGGDGYKPGTRQSWACEAGLGPLKERFATIFEAQREDLCGQLGIPSFELRRSELELVAHRQGSFFLPHLDTFTAADRADQKSDRVLTMVYYFHAAPRRFTGGEIAIYPFGPGEPLVIDPADNRLVAFPSFAMHEVKPISTPEGDRFEDARFAVNCWFHRPRGQAQ